MTGKSKAELHYRDQHLECCLNCGNNRLIAVGSRCREMRASEQPGDLGVCDEYRWMGHDKEPGRCDNCPGVGVRMSMGISSPGPHDSAQCSHQ